MKDKHYYLVREAGSDKVLLVYNFMTFSWDDGTTDHDVRVVVFCDQNRWGLRGWNCGTSVVSFCQHVKYEEVLAEVSKAEVDSLFDVMRETTDEAKKWVDAEWKAIGHFSEAPYSCMYECGKYPYFTFWSKETDEVVILWSDLFAQDCIASGLISPEGERGQYYEIPKSVFEKARELHKERSNMFVRRYRDFVYGKTGVTIPVKEYTQTEIEEKIAELERLHEESRRFFEEYARRKSGQ